jgi:DNA-binding transcriptional LysR family regulator
MDRLTSLTVFVRVVDFGGFSAAARRLNMSTTMVSNHVQSLEDRLGARLLNRTTRKVNLTEVGQAYYARSPNSRKPTASPALSWSRKTGQMAWLWI